MKNRLFLFVICVLCFIIFPISAATDGVPPVLRLASDAAHPGTFDPHFAASDPDRMLADMIFNGLLRYKPGNAPIIEPDLAEAFPRVEMIDEQQIWTFTLRRGVMFHPGPLTEAYELTADDVVFSLQKSADPAGGFIVSKRAVQAIGYEAFEAHPIGTGPFMFGSYALKEKLLLEANKRYFRGSPFLDSVEVLFMPDLAERERGLTSGRVDCICGKIDDTWIQKMRQEDNILIDIHGVREMMIIHFNMTVEPLDDARVRKAIAYALDRNEYLTSIGNDLADKVYSVTQEYSMQRGLSEEEVRSLDLDYSFDLVEAKQLLSEAGFSSGICLEVVASEYNVYRKAYEIMQSQLARIGIDLSIRIVDHAAMHDLIRQDQNPIVIYIAWRPNPDVYLTRFFHSDSIVVTGEKPDTNFSHFDRIDELIDAARLEVNAQKQIELWKHAQIKILDEMAAYPLLVHNLVFIRGTNIDYGHELVSSMALYPQITEKTKIENEDEDIHENPNYYSSACHCFTGRVIRERVSLIP